MDKMAMVVLVLMKVVMAEAMAMDNQVLTATLNLSV